MSLFNAIEAVREDLPDAWSRIVLAFEFPDAAAVVAAINTMDNGPGRYFGRRRIERGFTLTIDWPQAPELELLARTADGAFGQATVTLRAVEAKTDDIKKWRRASEAARRAPAPQETIAGTAVVTIA